MFKIAPDEEKQKDNEYFSKFNERLTLIKISLLDSSRDWNTIIQSHLPPLVEVFQKFKNFQYICAALGEYLLIMKSSGKILKKKAFFILVSYCKRKYPYDTDLVASCYLPGLTFDHIKDDTNEIYLYGNISDDSKIGDNLRMIHLVNDFFCKIFIKEDFSNYFGDEIFYKMFKKSKTFFVLFVKKFFRHLIEENAGDVKKKKKISFIL